VHFAFSKQLTCTVNDQFEASGMHLVSVRSLPLLANLSEAGSLYDHLHALCQFFEGKQPTLQDFLCAAYLFRHWEATGAETESKQALELLLRLTEALVGWSTEEIEPVVRDILSCMARCSLPFWKLMHGVLDRSLVESGRVPLGCHSDELCEFLLDFLNVSQAPEESTTRTLVLNSVRRSLRKLHDRSSTPCLLLLYDVCLEQLVMRYITEFPLEASLLPQLHRLSLVLEALELSSVCPEASRSYCQELDSVWRAAEALSEDSLEPVKSLLLDLLRTILRWSARYAAEDVLSADPLCLSDLLQSISQKYTRLLLPTLIHTLSLLDSCAHHPRYLPILPGSAQGKVLLLSRLAQVPSDLPAALVILTDTDNSQTLPKNTKALMLLQDISLDSRLVAYCVLHHVPLAIIAQVPSDVEGKTQVHIFEDSLDFV